MIKAPIKLSYIPLVLVVAFCAWIYYPSLTTPGPPLTFKIEGVLDSKLNYRDAGASINECAHEKLLPEGRLLRSSGFFSGWSCDRVGSPDVIYSLNYSDAVIIAGASVDLMLESHFSMRNSVTSSSWKVGNEIPNR